MMNRKHIESEVKAHFAKDTANHVMQIIRDNGVCRHIRFRKPGTMIAHFDLITWPGYLCYTGDMGTYVFQRLEDMFEFFRTDSGRINLGYWSEKLQAQNCTGRHSGNSVEEFSEERFTAVIHEYLGRWIRDGKRDGRLDKDERRALWESVHDEVLGVGHDGKERALIAANDFRWTPDSFHAKRKREYSFEDIWEHNFTEYTHHFVWCCLAIAWAIGVYDKAKEDKYSNAAESTLETVP